MTPSSTQPAFPIARAALALTAASVAAYGLASVTVPRFYGSTPAVGNAILATAATVWATAMFGLLPVTLAGPMGVMPTVYAYFAGMMLRFPVCLGATLYFNHILNLPSGPLFVGLLLCYPPLLFIEAGFVGLYLWKKDFLVSHSDVAPATGNDRSSEVPA